MSKRYVGPVMMLIGISAVVAGLGLSGYNLWDNHRAGIRSDALSDAIVRYRKASEITAISKTPVTPLKAPSNLDRELPVLELDDYRYIGTVSIPAIDVTLPVQEDWSLARLKTSPCRYMGSPYRGDLIICAHNYAAHFGRLKDLRPGDEVFFTDVEGNEFNYTVVELETLAGTAVEEMVNGTWDLTLFTCTLGGRMRVTVRCGLHVNDET
ncbi:MAG: sortase [Lachnospiraceae bacterium]|nr:sortase [Lachnospiraceae bacterium]